MTDIKFATYLYTPIKNIKDDQFRKYSRYYLRYFI